jgi:nitrous oxide reductase
MTTNAPGSHFIRRSLVAGAALIGLASCGGGGSNPLGNATDISNPGVTGGQKLSFAYFQKCVNPILLTPQQINQGGVVSTNTCAGSGCHANATGTGGALRIEPAATAVDVTDAANTADVIRATDMYKNFYSSQGATIVGTPTQSRLVTKPLVLGVLHGGGQIFVNEQDPNIKIFEYWISHPSPQGQDEFSTATYSMFTPADPQTGTCNTQ